MFAERPRISAIEVNRFREQNQRLANLGLSLAAPDNLLAALRNIQVTLKDRGVVPGKYEDLPGIAYFLGEEMAALQWATSTRTVGISPFAGLETIATNVQKGPNVVLVGCWGARLLEQERVFLNRVGITPETNHIVDTSALPIFRLQALEPNSPNIHLANAAGFDFTALRPDLILTDLFFDTPSQTSQAILEQLMTSLPENGRLLTRVCLIPDVTKTDYFHLLDIAGQFWSGTTKRIFGLNPNTGRDNY